MNAKITLTDDYGCTKEVESIPDFQIEDHMLPCGSCGKVVFTTEVVEHRVSGDVIGCSHCTPVMLPTSEWTSTHISNVYTWNSGGHVMIDSVNLPSGLRISIGDECLIVFKDPEQEEKYGDTGDDEHTICTVGVHDKTLWHPKEVMASTFLEAWKKLCQPLNELGGPSPYEYARLMREVVTNAAEQIGNCADAEDDVPYDVLNFAIQDLTNAILKLATKANDWVPGYHLAFEAAIKILNEIKPKE